MFYQLLVFIMLFASLHTGVDVTLCVEVLIGAPVALAYMFFPLMRAPEGYILCDSFHAVLGLLLYVFRSWSLSGRMLNRLMHALNGNIVFSRRAAWWLVPFAIIFAVALVLDLLTGFQMGWIGHARVYTRVVGQRMARFWRWGAIFIAKSVVFSPLYLVLFVGCFPVFILSCVYEFIGMLVVVFKPEWIEPKHEDNAAYWPRPSPFGKRTPVPPPENEDTQITFSDNTSDDGDTVTPTPSGQVKTTGHREMPSGGGTSTSAPR